MNRTGTLLLALLTASVALAGCADGGDGSTTTATGTDPANLSEGKGAIAGLVVDDRFRPIAGAQILVQEAGTSATSNENGEFTVIDLDPGTYTLRATAEGHEAPPQRVTVEEGAFADAQILARRVISDSGSIITQEFSAFAPCQASAPIVTAQCGLVTPPDLSGDTDRPDFWTNFTAYDVRAVVIEMLANKEASSSGALKVVVRNGTNDCYVINTAITSGNYIKAWLKHGEVSPFDIEDRNCIWTNEDRQLVQLWAQGFFKEETQNVYEQGLPLGESRGLGIQLGVRAKFVVTAFVGEPEVDIEEYCVLC